MKKVNSVVIYLNEELNIVHNDIKLKNILYKYLDKKKEIIDIKLCDLVLICINKKNIITKKIEGISIY